MIETALYRKHLAALDRYLQDALERARGKGKNLDAVLFFAGRARTYHRDDQDIAFRSTPHFRRYVPLEGPEHCLLVRPGTKPRLVHVAPRDYWYEAETLRPSYWQSEIDVEQVATFDELPRVLGPLSRTAFVGSPADAAAMLGIADDNVEPEVLLAPLDWHRATKTDYEIALMVEAAHNAGAGHRAAHDAFLAGADEREIHWAYLRGAGSLEREVPYENIVAIDEKSATLHYQNKRTNIPTARRTLLVDAGATCAGYASDITRTWAKDNAEPVYRALLVGIDAIQRELVDMVTPGRAYPDIHFAAHRKIACLLAETRVISCSADAAFESGITRTFLPHGVGHHLGLQVHDVGGRQSSPDGGLRPPPPEHRFLRNTRVLEPGHVVTIEPGIYFIPMLLAELQAQPAARDLDWSLIEKLVPCGGMRIEDDILCTGAAPRDLTRSVAAGPRGH